MSRQPNITFMLLAATLLLASCGGGGGGGFPAGSTTPPVTPPTPPVVFTELDNTFGDDVNPADGTPDGFAMDHDAAGGNGWDYGSSIALDASGKIYVAGYSENAALDFDMTLWRFTAAGALDDTFGPDINPADGTQDGFVVHDSAAGGNGDDYGYAVTLDATGKIYVAGSSTNAAGNQDMTIWRYTSDGVLDTGFGGTGYVFHDNAAGGSSLDYGRSVALDAAGRINVTGASLRPSRSGSYMTLWRYTSAGVLDPTFGPDINPVNGTPDGFISYTGPGGGRTGDYGGGLVFDSSDKIYVAGAVTSVVGDLDMALWRFTSSGTLDPSFGTNGFVAHHDAAGGDSSDYGMAIALDSTEMIYITGSSMNISGDDDMTIWRYTSSGALDTSFDSDGFAVHDNAAGGNGRDYGSAIVIDSSERVIVAGRSMNANDDMAIWRYTSSGALDTTFGGDVNPADGTPDGFVLHNNAAGGDDQDYAASLILDSSDRICVAGTSSNVAGDGDMTIWRYQ